MSSSNSVVLKASNISSARGRRSGVLGRNGSLVLIAYASTPNTYSGLLCACSTKEKLRILLEGPAGSGKSIALATMVERCRAANWQAWVELSVLNGCSLMWQSAHALQPFGLCTYALASLCGRLLGHQWYINGCHHACVIAHLLEYGSTAF
eukprot:1160007-Pelagomonas_calceolata.AAC.7